MLGYPVFGSWVRAVNTSIAAYMAHLGSMERIAAQLRAEPTLAADAPLLVIFGYFTASVALGAELQVSEYTCGASPRRVRASPAASVLPCIIVPRRYDGATSCGRRRSSG